jgi:predicted nucleotidyltransferase
MIIPNMGRTISPAGLADALFTPVQQRLLGLLFGQPERCYQSAELIRLAKSGVGAVHRQLARLEKAGLVAVTRGGNQKFYQAHQGSPVFAELHGLVVKTVGVTEPLQEALAAYADKIRAAFVFGSVAKGDDHAGSDIDLMVISDELHYPDLFEALQPVETRLARPINPTIWNLADWRSKRAREDSFAARVDAQPKLFVIGSVDDLT